MKALISVTAKAAQYLQKVAKRSSANNVLLSLESGGCNGFSYKIEPVSEIPAQSLQVKTQKQENEDYFDFLNGL